MAELAAGTLVAQIYRVREPLGAGGFGETYLADNITLRGGEVVVKTVASPDQGLEEAQTLVALQSPNVVRVLAFDEQRRAIVMERAVGEPLANLIGRIDLLTSIRVVEAVAGALSDLERSQLVHRDVKPENVMVQLPEGGGRLLVKLIDFGIALRAGKPLTSDPVGSPLYCPVEQHDRHQPPHSTDDIYALGAVLFHLVAGRPPFEPTVLTEGERAAMLARVGLSASTSQPMVEAIQLRTMHERAEVPSLLDAVGASMKSERERFIVEKLDQLIGRMMAKSRGQRPRAREVEAQLDSLQSSFSEAATSVTSVQNLTRPKRPTATLVLPRAKVAPVEPNTAQLAQAVRGRSRGRVLVIMVALLVLGGLSWAVFGGEPPPPAPRVVPPRVELVAVAPPEPPVAPSAPVADIDAGDELAPLAVVKPAPPPIKPVVPSVKPAAASCVADAQWRAGAKQDLQGLNKLTAQRNLYDEYDDRIQRLLDGADAAKTESDCRAVNDGISAIERELKKRGLL